MRQPNSSLSMVADTKVRYIRDKHVIRDIAAGKVVYFGKMQGEASINAAKRESMKLQMKEDGGRLGSGSLRVAT